MSRPFYSDKDCQFFVILCHFRKNYFNTSILKSLLILAIWLALSTINFFRITLSFAQSESCQALSIWQNRKWAAPKKHPTIIHWHIWSLNFISRTFDGMWVGFHNRKYDQSEKSKICPKDHLWLSLSWNKELFLSTPINYVEKWWWVSANPSVTTFSNDFDKIRTCSPFSFIPEKYLATK